MAAGKGKKATRTVLPKQAAREKLSNAGNITAGALAVNPPVPAQRKEATDEKDVLGKMGQAFGEDFSDVKLHTNSGTASELDTDAFAQGSEVHFKPGSFDPDSEKGMEMIGHELSHVVQQRQGKVAPTVQAKGMAANNEKSLEKEADNMGAKAARNISQKVPSFSTVMATNAPPVQANDGFKKKGSFSSTLTSNTAPLQAGDGFEELIDDDAPKKKPGAFARFKAWAKGKVSKTKDKVITKGSDMAMGLAGGTHLGPVDLRSSDIARSPDRQNLLLAEALSHRGGPGGMDLSSSDTFSTLGDVNTYGAGAGGAGIKGYDRGGDMRGLDLERHERLTGLSDKLSTGSDMLGAGVSGISDIRKGYGIHKRGKELEKDPGMMDLRKSDPKGAKDIGDMHDTARNTRVGTGIGKMVTSGAKAAVKSVDPSGIGSGAVSLGAKGAGIAIGQAREKGMDRITESVSEMAKGGGEGSSALAQKAITNLYSGAGTRGALAKLSGTSVSPYLIKSGLKGEQDTALENIKRVEGYEDAVAEETEGADLEEEETTD